MPHNTMSERSYLGATPRSDNATMTTNKGKCPFNFCYECILKSASGSDIFVSRRCIMNSIRNLTKHVIVWLFLCVIVCKFMSN